jgi:cyclohexyl-isocyanide hydratase
MDWQERKPAMIGQPNAAEARHFQVNIVLVPRMVQLDVTGPFEVLARVPGWSISLVAATLDPVRTDRGLRIVPDVTRENAAPADLLVVPGGTGIDFAMIEPEWIAFVQRQAISAEHVFGICTGSLLLAAAGLLRGRRAGAHWQARDLLTQFGVTPSDERVTVDGKYYTSGGITSGIDVALRVVADLKGETVARKIQLAIEYDPSPPFPGGTPVTSPPEIVQAVLADSLARRAEREDMVAQAAARLGQQ